MRLRIAARDRVGPSVRPVLFSNDKKAVFEGEKSSNYIKNNDTMIDDEVVASDVPPRYMLLLFWEEKSLVGIELLSTDRQKHDMAWKKDNRRGEKTVKNK